jgi:hypothetical protein
MYKLTLKNETICELENLNEGLRALAQLATREGDALVAEEMKIRIAMNLAEIERLGGARQ